MVAHRIARFAAIGAALAFAGAALAQERTRISFTVPASVTKYTAQHVIPVGDVPGHEVRIFSIVRTLGSDAPRIAGQRITEIHSVGYSDYTNLNGAAVSHNIWVTESGDKFFVRTDIVSHNAAWSGGKGAENKTSGPITGGTGKLAMIRGTTRNASTFDPKSGSNASRFDIEYWIDAGK